MFKGGVSFNPDTDRAVRLIALLGTPIYAGYNLLVMFGLSPSTNYTNSTICLIISILWVLVGVYHYSVKIRSQADMWGRLVLYHGLALATVMFITGFVEPFSSSIALLFLASNIYFGRKALLISVGSVIAAGALDAAVRFRSQPDIIINNALGVAGIIILGVAMIGIIVAQETRRQALLKSQKQARLQYNRILTIINNLADAALSVDADGTINLYNAASLNLLDTNEDVIGRSIDQLLKLTTSTGEKVSLRELLSHTTRSAVRDDLYHAYSKDDNVRLEITYAPIRSSFNTNTVGAVGPDDGGYIVIMRDVTKAKSLEEERDEFISVVSHELRTPVTIMEGALSNLQVMMTHPDIPQKTLADGVAMAHDQVLYLAKMINDLSTLSRAERGIADAPELIDVAELGHKMFEAYHPDAIKRNLQFDIDLGAKLGYVYASRLYVEELLQNFLTNSLKYTRQGGMKLSIKHTGGAIEFTVKDTGIGISKSDQQKLFQKFFRSEDYRTRETSGTGLGLYVTRKLAAKIGTEIEFSSRLNHGSSFSFKLKPASEAQIKAGAPHASPYQSALPHT